ncbi:(d)CMP kinase [Paenibacillus sp. F411]|uniref:Cytidylate kinase n=1 Tax=Paenibacillus algicola TaxID=2565926 RepID=A0A4P8XIU4_9BACL|nr:(d)CMP kinase [Paenibacillus algicola]MBO2945043.1 (d)CMP kinase [Paenibacillus sp. F411]QCT02542.1 cytidylate kinase [Paenibacillus algicola]
MHTKGTGEQNRINIAIDGPAGAGKSTVARMVASRLQYIYVDTGAMYRAVTWYMQSHGISAENEQKVLQTVQNMVIELKPHESGQMVLLNGEDVTPFIRSQKVNSEVSRYAQIEDLRHHLVHLQRMMALSKGVVMDGRDIGTTVLPAAEVKIFMTASVKERALRRFKELDKAEGITLEQLETDIARRDRLDEEREVSPLRRAEDAVFLDTTDMNIDEVVEYITSFCRTRMDGEKEQ